MSLYRKRVDESTIAESCYSCLADWQIRDEAVSLRCGSPYWTYEACESRTLDRLLPYLQNIRLDLGR